MDWQETGLSRAEVGNAVGLGLSPDEVREWAPFHPLEIYWARKRGLPLAEARRWAARGVPVRDTIRAMEVGLSLEELNRWEASGFNAADAWEAKETGVGIAEVVAWREAGFVVPDALQLIRDSWSLSRAIVARYDGVHPYGPAPT
jgi:hypothetical protein